MSPALALVVFEGPLQGRLLLVRAQPACLPACLPQPAAACRKVCSLADEFTLTSQEIAGSPKGTRSQRTDLSPQHGLLLCWRFIPIRARRSLKPSIFVKPKPAETCCSISILAEQRTAHTTKDFFLYEVSDSTQWSSHAARRNRGKEMAVEQPAPPGPWPLALGPWPPLASGRATAGNEYRRPAGITT